jgi:hypothetical protein
MIPTKEIEAYVYVVSDGKRSIEISLLDSPVITDLDTGDYYPCNWENFYGRLTEVYFDRFHYDEDEIEPYWFIVKKYSERFRTLFIK